MFNIEYHSFKSKIMLYQFSKLNKRHQITTLKQLKEEIKNEFSELLQYYPNFMNWFNKVQQELFTSQNREIFFIINNQKIIGFSILKRTDFEYKICTLIVQEQFRNKGFGTILMKKSLEYLDNCVQITVSEKCLNEFLPLLNNFNFQFDKKINNYCNLDRAEYYFKKE